MNVVAYIRVSTNKQEASGLGLEAQRNYIQTAAHQQGWKIVAEYIDTVSGAIAPDARPECSKALSHKMPIVIAKLDRLSRDVEHIAAFMKRAKDDGFKVATMPNARPFELHLFAALAEQERKFIGQRTKDALGALEQRAKDGDVVATAKVKRRNEALSKGRTSAAAAKAREGVTQRVSVHHAAVRPHIEACLYNECKTLQSIADCLNSKGIQTSRRSEWNPTQVRRVMLALSLSF